MAHVKLERLYKEMGLYDPAIFKCVFVVGGPGSGKSFVVRKLGLSSMGLVTINSDEAFEYLMRKRGLSFKMPSEEEPERDLARIKAKTITKEKTDHALEGRLGVVIDGTGAEYDKVIKIKTSLERLGYDCYMIVVNTRLDVAKFRNSKRERSVPEKVLVGKWTGIQDNIGKFANAFDNFSVIDNNEYDSKQIDSVYVKVLKFVKQAPSKPEARKWIEDQKKTKNNQPKKEYAMRNTLNESKRMQKMAGLISEDEYMAEDSGLVVRSLGGDPYDAGISYRIEKDGQVMHSDTVFGDHPIKYNGQEYPDLESLSQALGAEFIVEPYEDDY